MPTLQTFLAPLSLSQLPFRWSTLQKDPGLRPLLQPCFLGWMLGCCVLRHLGQHVEPVPSSFGRQDSQVPHGDSMSHLSWIAGVSLFSDLCCCH